MICFARITIYRAEQESGKKIFSVIAAFSMSEGGDGED